MALYKHTTLELRIMGSQVRILPGAPLKSNSYGQPMAARLADSPERAEAILQRLQQSVMLAHWAEGEVYRRLRQTLEKGCRPSTH